MCVYIMIYTLTGSFTASRESHTLPFPAGESAIHHTCKLTPGAGGFFCLGFTACVRLSYKVPGLACGDGKCQGLAIVSRRDRVLRMNGLKGKEATAVMTLNIAIQQCVFYVCVFVCYCRVV